MNILRRVPIPDGDPYRGRIRRRHLVEWDRYYTRLSETPSSFGEQTIDSERRALCFLHTGLKHEAADEYEKAAERYRLGLSCEPGDRFCAYFLHNNYGYCLNVLGRHAEAEPYCRMAIGLDPSRPNGFKNLGISLEARGEYELAVEAWIAATQVYPEPRSLAHFECLLEEEPYLESDLGLGQVLEECRREVH